MHIVNTQYEKLKLIQTSSIKIYLLVIDQRSVLILKWFWYVFILKNKIIEG